MSFNIEGVLPSIKAKLLDQLDTGMAEGMEIIKSEAIKLSDARIYNTPLPSKYAKRTGNYKKSFEINKVKELSYEFENSIDYGVYVEYKHGYLIVNDAVFNNIDKVVEAMRRSIK